MLDSVPDDKQVQRHAKSPILFKDMLKAPQGTIASDCTRKMTAQQLCTISKGGQSKRARYHRKTALQLSEACSHLVEDMLLAPRMKEHTGLGFAIVVELKKAHLQARTCIQIS